VWSMGDAMMAWMAEASRWGTDSPERHTGGTVGVLVMTGYENGAGRH
jgi:hypothetical protein